MWRTTVWTRLYVGFLFYTRHMQVLSGKDIEEVRRYFQLAADVAKDALCHRAHCGTVIVNDGVVIGQGSNGPVLNEESNRMCDASWDVSLKPKYEKTCCVHAEWRAILDACKRNPSSIPGSTLYFMRVDDEGNFTIAGVPYCTTCSRLALESGIGRFALWQGDTVSIYDTHEYNRQSYEFFAK